MRTILTSRGALVVVLLAAGLFVAPLPGWSAQQSDGPQVNAPKKSRVVGTIKAINSSNFTLQTDNGSEMNVVVDPTTRLVRLEPGQTDLKSAPAMQVSDIQVGDRILAAGTPSPDGKSLSATTAVLMKKADVSEKQQHEREEWQKNGVAGVVKSVDLSGETITLATGALSNNTLTLHVSKDTVIRRYAPDSVKFDDAKPGSLEQIKEGDQLRARGSRSADGKELTAAEIVSGTFRNVAGIVVSTDSANNTLTVTDLATKRPVTLRVAPDSQMHQLPPMFAQRIAMRLKGGAAAPASQGSGAPTGHAQGGERPAGAGGGFAGRGGGPPDFQQILSRMTTVALKDLQKGSALMIVATEGTADAPSQVIVLLSGVEPILTAASPREASTILSPWNLSAGANAGTGDTP
jgi:hypothetical protein